jgi:hypothetical protein
MVSFEWNILLVGGIECWSWSNFPSPRAQSQQWPLPGPFEGRPAGPSRGDALTLESLPSTCTMKEESDSFQYVQV